MVSVTSLEEIMHQATDVALRTADGAQWGIVRSIMEAKVADSFDNANHGADIEVAGPGVADNLATDTIFLGSERESDESDAVEVSELASERIKAIVVNE
jgi:hypothetical protein